MATVGAWPVPDALPGRRGGVARPGSPSGRRGGVARPCVPNGRRGGVAHPLGFVWPPWGRGLSPGPRMTAVEAWPIPWAPYGPRGCVARF